MIEQNLCFCEIPRKLCFILAMEYLEIGSLSCLITPLHVALEEVRHGPRVSADVTVPLHWPLSDSVSVAIITRNGISSFFLHRHR